MKSLAAIGVQADAHVRQILNHQAPKAGRIKLRYRKNFNDQKKMTTEQYFNVAVATDARINTNICASVAVIVGADAVFDQVLWNYQRISKYIISLLEDVAEILTLVLYNLGTIYKKGNLKQENFTKS